jgi:hypothetical protein
MFRVFVKVHIIIPSEYPKLSIFVQHECPKVFFNRLSTVQFLTPLLLTPFVCYTKGTGS